MTDDLEYSGQWRGTVEARLSKLEATVEEQARLRAAMDKDMGDLKAGLGAQLKALNAISETQSDHTRRLTRLEAKMDAVEGRLETVEGTLSMVHAGVQLINDKLDRLIDDETANS